LLVALNGEDKDEEEEGKNRWIDLQKVLMIKFKKDQVVIPPESSWFGQYDANFNLMPYNQTLFYKNDTFGLRTTDEQGKLKFVELDGNHLEFTSNDIKKHVIPFLAEEP
jgi:palmitoyl-protein thioesterase